jgi:radical SAM superfamily enzyme YgiQ (UPF0313 family)
VFIGGVLGGLNPSPLLPFADAVLAGEGEGVIPRIAEILLRHRSGPHCKAERLEALSECGGVIFPARPAVVTRQIVDSLESHPTYTPIVTPHSSFGNLFVVELTRGCGRKCHFCAGGKVYGRPRIHSSDSVLECVAARNPGANRIGLEGASLSDHPDLIGVSRRLVEAGHEISFSSIRIDRITPPLLDLLQKGNVRSFTVAPEAGSEGLRSRIGKPLTDSALDAAIRMLAETSIETLKLYFLIGLPGETDGDVEAAASLVRASAGRFCTRPGRRLRISVNAFVPKPGTEFQWAGMAAGAVLLKRRALLESRIGDLRRVVSVEKSGREEMLQGLLSRGDARAGLAVYHRVVAGLPWKAAWAKAGIDPDRLLHEPAGYEDALPWDFIRGGASKRILWERYRAAVSGETGGIPARDGETDSQIREGSGPARPGLPSPPDGQEES